MEAEEEGRKKKGRFSKLKGPFNNICVVLYVELYAFSPLDWWWCHDVVSSQPCISLHPPPPPTQWTEEKSIMATSKRFEKRFKCIAL